MAPAIETHRNNKFMFMRTWLVSKLDAIKQTIKESAYLFACNFGIVLGQTSRQAPSNKSYSGKVQLLRALNKSTKAMLDYKGDGILLCPAGYWPHPCHPECIK